MKRNSNLSKPERVLLAALAVIFCLILILYVRAESQVEIKGLALDEIGNVSQGLYIAIFDGNLQVGSTISFENTSWEGQTPNSRALAEGESNFELILADRYDFSARPEYVGAIKIDESKYISSPSGHTLQVVVVRDQTQITSAATTAPVPGAAPVTQPEPPDPIKLFEYLVSQGGARAIGVVIILILVAIITGVFKRFVEAIAEKLFGNLFKTTSAKVGLVELVETEKGYIVVGFARKNKVKEGTRLLIRGEVIDPSSSRVVRPVIGTATIYKLLENNRYWALIDKVHQKAQQNPKFRITQRREVEICKPDDTTSAIDLDHLRLGDKGRVYKADEAEIRVNIGSVKGVKKGTEVEVVEPEIDLNGQYLGDLPVATLKVIACEANISICSVEKERGDGKAIALDALVRVKKP